MSKQFSSRTWNDLSIVMFALLHTASGCGYSADDTRDTVSRQIGAVSNVRINETVVTAGEPTTMTVGERLEFELTATHPSTASMTPSPAETDEIVRAAFQNPAPLLVMPWWTTNEGVDKNPKPNPNYAAAYFKPASNSSAGLSDELVVRGVVVAPNEPGDYELRLYVLPMTDVGTTRSLENVGADGGLQADRLAGFPVVVKSH